MGFVLLPQADSGTPMRPPEAGPADAAHLDAIVDADLDAATQGYAGLDATTAVDAGHDATAVVDAAHDANAAVDASLDATTAIDAELDAVPVADAGNDPSALRIRVQDVADGTPLAGHAVRVTLRTGPLVAAGDLAADCQNLRITGGEACDEARPFFLPVADCSGEFADVWVRVSALSDGDHAVWSVAFDPAMGPGSDGRAVFSFFDGFEDSVLDTETWILHGDGNAYIAAGELHTEGAAWMESASRLVRAGQSTLGIRIAAMGGKDTDVELGVGQISGSTIWAYGRIWDGVTFLSYDTTTYAFDSEPGSPCEDLSGGVIPASLGGPWVDVLPDPTSFLTAEFGYANASGRTEAWLRTSRGGSFTYTSPEGCTLPDALPVVVSLDHYSVDAPVQRVDYVYVRPSAPSEPNVEILPDSTLPCTDGSP